MSSLVPGSPEWEDHFTRFQNWTTIRITPTTKRLHEQFSRFNSKTCFAFAPGTYYGPIVIRGSACCLLRGEGPGVVLVGESDHHPAITVESTHPVQIQNMSVVGKGSTQALYTRPGSVVQAVDCGFQSAQAEAVVGQSHLCLNRCTVGGTATSGTQTGVSITTSSAEFNISLLHCIIERCGLGLLTDGSAKFRVEECKFRTNIGTGVVAGGSSNGVIRRSELSDNGQNGLVCEADARVFTHQCSIAQNAETGVLACDNSHCSIIECQIHGNKGPRQIGVLGSATATIRDSQLALNNDQAFGVCLMTCDVSDAVVEGNHFFVQEPVQDQKDKGDQTNPAAEQTSSATATSAGPSNSSAGVPIVTGADLYSNQGDFNTAKIAVLVDGSSSPLLRLNTFRMMTSSNASWGNSRHAYAVVLGLWHNAKLDRNGFEHFDADRNLFSLDSAGAVDHHFSSSTWKTRSKRRTPQATERANGGSRPASATVARSSGQNSPTPTGGNATNSANDVPTNPILRLSSMWRQQHQQQEGQEGDSENPVPKKPIRPRTAPSSRAHQPHPPTAKTSNPEQSSGELSSEVQSLRHEVERLKARLKMKSKVDSGRPQSSTNSRPQSASARGRTSSVHSDRGGETDRSSSSRLSGTNLRKVGRYMWDMDKLPLFNKLQIPLSEVRVESEPITVPGDVPTRLHDSWLEARLQRARDAEMKEQMEKGWKPKLDSETQKSQVLRLHDAAVSRFQEGAKRLHEKYFPESPRRKLTFDELHAFNDRIFTKHEIYKKELQEKLWKKHVLDQDRRKHVSVPRKAIEVYCASLYKSHRNPELVQAAAKATGEELKVVSDRSSSSKPVRIPQPPKPRAEVETYCASLHMSHQDAVLARAADEAAHTHLIERVASRSQSRTSPTRR